MDEHEHTITKRPIAAFQLGARLRVNLHDDGSPEARARLLKFYGTMLNLQRKRDHAMNRTDEQQAPATPVLPTDVYSVAYRQLCDHPEAVRAASTLTLSDFFGRSETWVVETFRLEGNETVFLQRMATAGSFRLVLPPEVTATIGRQRDRAVTGTRKRSARAVVEARRARGETLGNPEALAKGRAAKRSKRSKRSTKGGA